MLYWSWSLEQKISKNTISNKCQLVEKTGKMQGKSGGMRLLRLFLLVTLLTGADADNDYTCTSSQPLFPSVSPVHLYLAGSGRPPIHFDRYLASGNTVPFTEGNQTQLSEDIAGLEIPASERKHPDTRAGVFSCTSSTNGSSVSVLLLNHRKNSKILPKEFVTITASVGETVNLSINSKTSKIYWRKKGLKIPQWNGLTSVTLSDVSTNDEGVYEAYTCAHRPHAYMRLIVKKCPRNRYGIGCEQYCICYNGGICNDVGECICPPGFIGNSCEDVNSPNCFGAQCQYLCDDEVFNLNHFQGTCGGNLFCLPDPYGCSCSPGYHGLGCDEECAEGKFGANCQQTCHCASGSTCDNKMGLCTPSNCQDGWTGVNCNQQITCRHEPCLNGGTCYENQTPQDFWCSCRTGFTGDRCAACGGVFTNPTGILYSPLHPEQYPNNSRCSYVIEAEEGEFIRLTFTIFSVEYDLHCEYDYVEVYDDTTGGLMGRYCGDDIPPVLTSQGHVMTVVFYSDSSVTETGFTAIYEVLESSRAACGGVFTDPTGTFHSPLYPEHYPNNSRCNYVIEAEEGEFIRLNFTMFSIEYHNNCQFDYVEVYDNTTGGLMGRYCGDDIPPALTSEGHIMTVVFHSDDINNDDGFTANYEVLGSSPAACGGVFTDPTGTFHSPLYPEQYPTNSRCIYVIEAEEGEFIRLTFTTFSLEYDLFCEYDYVEVYDNTTGDLTERYCGDEIPPALTSEGHIMTVVFHSDSSVTHDGFTANYRVFGSSPGEGLIRLVGGATASEGRVEVFHDGEWGTICGDLWDNDDATVICRQLGFGDSGSGLVSTTFGQGVGKIWLDEVDCSGSESKISDCGSRGWGVHDCSHDDDAGVICEMS